DMAADGEGFFQIRMYDGSIAYTRDGAFNMSLGGEGLMLSTAEGYDVLGIDGEPITFSDELDPSKIKMDEYGRFMYPDDTDTYQLTGQQIAMVQFNNAAGLDKISGSNLKATPNSGEPRLENEDPVLRKTKVRQGYLEASNVQTVDEVVNLIVAQRAYEMNSKVITASDEMLQQANNLRS
ncbi:MAG: flagellar hook-basal body complex protein, partial [Lachnospiraceae bacterium]|nr:flagellar hook-basal body complex protein [Lachnospiraceae bacterium]